MVIIMRKILVLGSNGGIVRYLIDYFNENGSENFEIIGTGRHDFNFGCSKPNFTYLKLDICTKKIFANCN